MFVLRRLSVWELMQDTPPLNERSDYWDSKNLLALSEIHLACEPKQQNLIALCHLAREAWDILEATYNTKSFVEIKQMEEEFIKLSKRDDESCQTWICRVKETAFNLASAGRPMV